MRGFCTRSIRQISLQLLRPSGIRSHTSIQHFGSTAFNMSSDQDYASFLEKANQDTGSSQAPKDSGFAQTKAVDAEVPGPLKNLDAFYISESDEPFEPVAIKHKKDGSLSEGM